MKKLFALAFVVSGCALSTPAQPTTTPQPSRSEPSRIVIDFVSGPGTARITARVLNVYGDALMDQVVAFSSDVGTIAPTFAVTDMDGAATLLTASKSAKVKAFSGSIVGEGLVAVQPLPLFH